MRNTRKIVDLIGAIYGRRYRLTQPRRPTPWADPHPSSAIGGFLEEGGGFVRKHIVLVLIATVLTLKLILAYHYYNRLVNEYSNVRASYSDMSVQVQRRNDIGRNLIQAIHYYSQYEERVYSKIVRLRTTPAKGEEQQENLPGPPSLDSPPAAQSEQAAALAAATNGLSGGAGLMAPLSKLMALAEQYPDLKSEMNYTVLLSALVELEKDLAAQRIKFNAEANVYTTTLRQFPSNIFAWIFRFEDFPYFDSTQEAKEFKLAE